MVREVEIQGGLKNFRDVARGFVLRKMAPADLHFFEANDLRSPSLFGAEMIPEPEELPAGTLMVPEAYLKLAETVAAHASPEKWDLLYRLLWRLKHENRHLLEIAIDDDVRTAQGMEKAVRRDIHKMHAFVRFEKRRAEGDLPERYLAWIETENPVLKLAAPFFARRFGDMVWSILTPHGSAHYDGKTLTFGEAVVQAPARTEDMDDLWKTYYRSSFNPARIKIRAMQAEMPLKYWKALPETEIISELLREAPERLTKMAARQNQRAHPPDTRDLRELEFAARSCRACPIADSATQTVFGEGPIDAPIMIVGEQPGEQEDLKGRPFTGPAGEVFNRALANVGLDRRQVYVTNSVKHFKWKPGPSGKPRLHQRASGSEMHACRPWLEREIEIIKPKVIICMGVTAATVLFGRIVKLSDEIGKIHEHLPWAPRVLVTYHPSAILRALSEDAKREMTESVEATLRLARETDGEQNTLTATPVI